MADEQSASSSKPANSPVVLHVMRTYGAHGGEHQLAQYFSTEPEGGVREHFAFVYRDPDCAALFSRPHSRVRTHNLFSLAIAPRRSAWREVLMVLALLPLLQLRLIRLMRQLKCQICVVHGIQGALVAWPAGMIWRRRIGFLYVHRITMAMRRPWMKWLYAPYDLLGGVSKAVTQSLAPIAGQARLVCLDNGIDFEAFEQQSRLDVEMKPTATDIIITVGRLLSHKRQALIIDAFARLAPTRADSELWIVGDGEQRPELEAIAARLGISHRVRFWGHRTDVAQLLSSATLFVHASAWEGMSNAVLEAMALGLSSVVVDAPGVSECHLPGETALIVPAESEALASAMNALLADPALRTHMGDRARSHVQARYSIEANRRRFLEVYRRLMRVA
jgi:glycosyltransferase involved in cell wall biosynthesis